MRQARRAAGGVSADTPSLLDKVTFGMAKSEGFVVLIVHWRLSEQFDSSNMEYETCGRCLSRRPKCNNLVRVLGIRGAAVDAEAITIEL